MRKWLAHGLLIAVTLVPANALAAQGECPGFESKPAGLMANSVDLDRVYGGLALDVMRAAAVGDSATLARRVSPDFSYELMRGDAGIAGKPSGVEGVIDFAGYLKPTAYRAWSAWAGPISVVAQECRWKVKLLFLTTPGEGAEVTFAFLDGRLVEAKGSFVDYREGPMPARLKP